MLLFGQVIDCFAIVIIVQTRRRAVHSLSLSSDINYSSGLAAFPIGKICSCVLYMIQKQFWVLSTQVARKV